MQSHPQEIANIRRAFASEKISIEGVAKAAIIKKEILNDFVHKKTVLNNFHFMAVEKAINQLNADAKNVLSTIDKHKAPGENELTLLKTFFLRYEINQLPFLNNNTPVYEKLKEWSDEGNPFPNKQLDFIKKSLHSFISETSI